MGWPRTKKPKSSALPAREHDGVHITAAPDAGPASAEHNTGTGQNTGVSGARHSVTEASHAALSARLSINEDVAPVNEEIANLEVPGTKVIAGSVVTGDGPGQAAESTGHESTGYDETAGIVYEVQPRGFEILGLDGAAHEVAEGAAPGAPAAGTPAAQDPRAQKQTADGDAPPQPAGEGSQGRRTEPEWNQTLASAPQPAEEERESRDNPFGRIFGRKTGGAAPDGGDPPLTRFRDLPLDQKMRIWRMRALIVVIVGVVFTLIASWEVGVTLAIVAGIADTIYRSRSAEAGHVAQPGTVDRATMQAQKRTIRQIAGMERAGYIAVHRRPIPDSTEVIDHLVIGPTGVYAIDSEKWDKGLPIRTRNGKQLWLGPESKKQRLEHARWEAEQASERLSARLGMEITVQPALAIYGPKIPWDIAIIRDVDVFSGDRLKKYLRRRARRKGVPHLTSEQIRKIWQAAIEVLPLEWQNAVTPVG
jgi:nuclease-like protein